MCSPLELIAYRPESRERRVELWRASFAHAVGAPVPHTVGEHRRFFDEPMRIETAVHLALQDARLVGFGAFTPASVVHLYGHVDHLGRDIGTRRLDRAKATSGGRLWPYAFATNTQAERFYGRHGSDIVERGFEPVMRLAGLRHEWRRASASPTMRTGRA